MRDCRVSEVLLHFIWKKRYYNHRELATEAGAPLFIHHPGEPNTDQGPDFSNARITIGDSTLEGPVELHVKASDYFRHGHTGDPQYQNVILHVVWINDTSEPPAGIPILALYDRIPTSLIGRYQQFMVSQSVIPCASLLPVNIPWAPFRDQLLDQRLAHRTTFIRTLIDEANPHWSEALYLLIARSLGQPLNTNAFLTIARSLPLNFLLRRRSDPTRLETLFKIYASRLDPPLSVYRMRPAHSPAVRLRQLADLLNNHTGRFTLLLESDDYAPILQTLGAAGLGKTMRNSILINAIVPLLYAYGTLRAEPQLCEKALRWLSETPPENNHVIRSWRELGMTAHTAADTQALLELRKNYCREKKCLDCTIGRHLLTAAPAPPPLPAEAPARAGHASTGQ